VATGSTTDFNLKRNEVIDAALRKVRAIKPSDLPTLEQTYQTAKVLNQIMREEDLAGVGRSVNLWALSEAALILVASNQIYGTSQGLRSNILDIVSVQYRFTDGEDTPVDLITAEMFVDIVDKDENGDPETVYFKRSRLLADQQFYVVPVPSSIGTTSEVIGSDTLNYQCILKHTSSSDNKPITGAGWQLYWQQSGTGGSAWVTATDYTNGELLWYVYKRPLYDFDAATDNPDMPSGWGRFLIYRLAHDISADYGLPLDERGWLQAQYQRAYENLFPSKKAVATERHGLAKFY